MKYRRRLLGTGVAIALLLVAPQVQAQLVIDKGQGVQRNISEAIPWYQKCAQGGDGTAMFRLAELYDTGEGELRTRLQPAHRN